MPQPSPRQRRPGVGHTHAVLHHPVRIHRRQQPPVKSREPIRPGFPPDAPFRLHPRQVAEPLLRHLLRPRPEAVADVVARDDQVPSIPSPPPHEYMGVRLVRVVMTGRRPVQIRLPKVRRDPPHDLPHIALQVVDPVAVLRRDDEAEMMPILAPAPGLDRRSDAVRLPIKELRSRPLDPGSGASEVDDMFGQGRRPLGALADVTRDQRLDDHPLSDVQPKGPARPSLRRPENA